MINSNNFPVFSSKKKVGPRRFWILEDFGGSSCPKELRTRRKNNIFDPDYFSSHSCHLSNRFIKKFRPGEAHTQNRRGPTFFCLKILENEDYLSFTAGCYHMVGSLNYILIYLSFCFWGNARGTFLHKVLGAVISHSSKKKALEDDLSLPEKNPA